ncbi:MAG TPA: formimidoylglutamate deiminase [Anaeromyxobacteraceae bacterium]|nr:formimidoylglutamate deiminase [Anaeromyxobacteraceae bacterium]
MPVPPRAYLPDLLFAGGGVSEGAALSVVDGAIAAVGEPEVGCQWVRLRGKAILPGLVSAHSHAFQRAIRGRTEVRLPGKSDFWSWRDAMYRAASVLDPEDMYAAARMTFHEMVRAGVTAVGEFHYLQRDPNGRTYDDPDLLAKQVMRAAREVGIRITLLRAAYARGRPGEAPVPAQRRFIDQSEDQVLESLLRLADFAAGDAGASVGLAPHSVRACPAEWIRVLSLEARRRAWPLHVHLAEQPAEVEQCRAEHGVTPTGLLERLGVLQPGFTAVHAIHLTPEDVGLLGRARVTVCACPTTERDLGDGIVPARELLDAGCGLALGSDSNVQIDLLEEARALEGHLRLERLTRGVLADESGEAGGLDGLARRLYGFASAGGMRSLGLPGGQLAPGEPADFVVVDLEDASVAGTSAPDLLPTVLFSGARSAVRDVYVGGDPVVSGGASAPGRTPGEEVAREFRATMRKLWAA